MVLRSATTVKDLSLPKRHFRGKRGGNGSSVARHGQVGEDTIVHVPVGTLIKKINVVDEDVDDEDEDDEDVRVEVLADFDVPDTEMIVATGGDGGLGNRGRRSRRRRRGDRERGEEREEEENEDGEEHHTSGSPGSRVILELELKTIADAGLVGLPNAGKSTLLRALSRAKPKVGSYPFTTLRPHLGMVQFRDGRDVTVADVPGLIEGAHENRGLGHDFLRHLERTRVLVYVVDASGANPRDDYETLVDELRLFSPPLLERPSMIVLNKIDEMTVSDRADIVRSLREASSSGNVVPIISISALTGANVADAALGIRALVFPESLHPAH